MATEHDQRETLLDAADRTRAAVGDPRFPALADEALQTFGDDLRSLLGRADSGELFTPLEVWTGNAWEPGCAVVVQDRGVLAWGSGRSRTQVIPRRRDPGGVTEVDVQPAAITLWIDCDRPLNVKVQRFAPGMDVPQTLADKLRQDPRDLPPTAVLPPTDEAQCPHCFEPVRAGADFCPSCGRHIGPKPPRSKKGLFIALGVLALLLILAAVAFALLGGDDEPARKATASAEPTAAPTEAAGISLPRRISGPGWRGRAPRAGWKVGPEQSSGGGALRVRVLTGPDGAVIRIFHTPKEKANPGSFRTGAPRPLETKAAESSRAIVKNFGTPECKGRNCSDLLLNDPAWGGIAITVNATRANDEKLQIATAIAQSIQAR